MARALLVTAIVAALAGYAIDCSTIVSPDQAMQCCKTMPCTPHSSGKNCCDTTPSTHPPFVQAASLSKATLSLVSYFSVPTLTSHLPIRSGADITVAQYQSPPPLLEFSSNSPLRI